MLNVTEDWLYEDGEDEIKGVYVNKFEEFRVIGEFIVGCEREESECFGVIVVFMVLVENFLFLVGDEAYVYIDVVDLEKVV